MTQLRTHYQNLKVDEKAPASVIKAAYRALSLEYHPDRKKDDPEADRIFKIIQNSYEILSDPVQRQKHDDWIKSQRDSSSDQKQKKESSDTKKEEPQYKRASYSHPLAFAVFVIISTVLMWNLRQSELLDRFLSTFLVKKESTAKLVEEATPLTPQQVIILPNNTDSTVSIADIDPISDNEAKEIVTESSTTTPINSLDPIREALLDIYEKANGDNWIYRSNWGVGDYCSWYGITCRDGKVVELLLEDNKVSGEISSKIGILTSLERLILDNFPFQIPGSPRYEGLKGEIPSSIGLLVELRELRLSTNLLSGDIPSIKNLVKLKTLELANNHGLTGPIPEGIENFSDLEVLDLSANRLTGVISGRLSKLTKLRYLGLQYNNFEGEIPSELGDLYNLTHLGLGGNNLTATIPVSFANLTKLERLFLQDNALTGKVPQFILQKKFDYLDISGNNFNE